MASRHFSLRLLLRLLLLTVGITTYVYACLELAAHPLVAVPLLVVAAQVFELWHFLQRTNRELARFLSSARHGDFSQSFDLGSLGCGFQDLGDAFTAILARLKEQRLAQEVELRQLRAMVEHMPVPLLALHEYGQVDLLNNAARRFFARNSVQRRNDLKKFGSHFHAQIDQCKPGEKRLASIVIEGNETQVILSLTAISGETGNLQLLSVQDIGQELALAQLDAWQDLVRVLTHEIMNSITPVASLAQTTADMAADLKGRLPEPHPRALEKISDAAGTVARRAGNLLQFVANYRQFTGLPEPTRRRLLVRDLFQHVSRIVGASERRTTLAVEISPPALEIYVDSEQLEQVLINLVHNAEQAIGARDDGRITLSACFNTRGQITLEVTDNGPGIDDKLLQKIFVPYFTTKAGGSGIGLALARQIVLAHGGAIRAGNAPGGGAVFSLTFP